MHVCPTATVKAVQISTLCLRWNLSKTQNFTALSWKKDCRVFGEHGWFGPQICISSSSSTWAIMYKGMSACCSVKQKPLSVMTGRGFLSLSTPFWLILLLLTGADHRLRVTLASLPSFIKQSQKPAVWVRRDPMWQHNHCFPWEDISHIRKSSEWEGEIYSSGLAWDCGKDMWCKLNPGLSHLHLAWKNCLLFPLAKPVQMVIC